jgi:hypothetical protein
VFLVRLSVILALCAGFGGGLAGQVQRAAPAGEERMIAVLPMIGSAQKGDNRRPQFFPADGKLPKGILSMRMELADDGKTAIVYLSAENQDAFEFLRTAKSAEVRLFDPHRHTKDEVEKEIQGLKKGLTLGQLKGDRP